MLQRDTLVLAPREVHTPGATLIWMALAAAAGCTNATAFLACERFVTHVTGIVTTVGLDAADLEHAADYSLVFGAFVLGAFGGRVLLGHGRARRALARVLVLVAFILACTGWAGTRGHFDEFGTVLDDPRSFLFLGALAFAMGLQNASVAFVTGSQVRTTHMTGPATDLGVALARWVFADETEVRREARRTARLRITKIVAYVGGAVCGGMLGPQHYSALFAPSVVILTVAAILTGVDRFTHYAHEDDEEEGEGDADAEETTDDTEGRPPMPDAGGLPEHRAHGTESNPQRERQK